MVNLASEAGGMGLGYLFYGYASVGEAMKAESHFAEGAFADWTLQGVVTNHLELAGSELLSKLLIGGGKGSFLVDGGAAALATILVGSASAGLTHG